jgi:hypothetical protein
MPKIQHVEIFETLKKMSEPWDLTKSLSENKAFIREAFRSYA